MTAVMDRIDFRRYRVAELIFMFSEFEGGKFSSPRTEAI
jgi:hypothetical protein